MQFISTTKSDGVTEQLFTISDVPGVIWSPAESTEPRPLVLLGHGGGQHKKAPGLLARSRRFVTDCGFVAAAIDAPGHGERPRMQGDEQFSVGMRERMASGRPLWPYVAQHNADIAAQAIPEWQATLDALLELDFVGGSVGYWGMSLGSGIGVPLIAAEPRITAAVLGLIGLENIGDAAARVTVPVEFLLQWDDEAVPRDSALALFDALGSPEKTLHANPGPHGGIPAFEMDSAERFFRRHLS